MKLSSMIIGTVSAVAVIAAVLWVLGFGFHSASSAQGSALYNPANEIAVKGVIEEIRDFDCPVSEYELSRHLMLKTPDGSVEVHLAPTRILSGQKLTFAPGDRVAVMGSKVKVVGRTGIIAREVTRGDETIIFRNQEGKLLLMQ